MKKNTSSAISAVLTFFLILFLVVPCHAEIDYQVWVGQWFKANTTDKGLAVTDAGTGKLSEKLLTYAYILSFAEQTYTTLLIQSDDGGETWLEPVQYLLTPLGGTTLDLVGYGLIPPGYVENIEMFAIVISLKGKEKDGVLKSAKISTVGGCVIHNLGGNNFFAASESFKAKLIPADKVENKVPEEVLELAEPFIN